MANAKEKKKTKKYLMVRLSDYQEKELERRRNSAQLSKEQYARCKIFDIPFEDVGGKPDRRPEAHATPV